MSYTEDLVGKRFGRLLVLSRNYERQKELFKQGKGNEAYWNCLCDCGNYKTISGSSLKNKKSPTLSCGCYSKEVRHRQKNTKTNKWIINEEITIGITSKGEQFIIDNADYDLVKIYCWRIDKHGYVVANARNGTNKIIRIHKLIMGVTYNQKQIVDHINWDKLDNRKCNLRFVTKSQNNINIHRKSNNKSGYTGVYYSKRLNKYCARIGINKNKIYLGDFNTFEEAVKARHLAELKIHGDWSGEINRQDYNKIGEI